MEYFCYISQTKIDNLLAAAEEFEVIEMSASETSTREKGVSASIGRLLGFIDTGGTYGRSDVFQKNVNLKRSYVQKLRKVLSLPSADDTKDFRWERVSADTDATVYSFTGDFIVDHVDETNFIATLRANSGYHNLFLDCSLRFFSRPPLSPNGDEFRVDSSNARFFCKPSLPLRFETIFFLLAQKPNETFGSPLFLKLAPVKNMLF